MDSTTLQVRMIHSNIFLVQSKKKNARHFDKIGRVFLKCWVENRIRFSLPSSFFCLTIIEIENDETSARRGYCRKKTWAPLDFWIFWSRATGRPTQITRKISGREFSFFFWGHIRNMFSFSLTERRKWDQRKKTKAKLCYWWWSTVGVVSLRLISVPQQLNFLTGSHFEKWKCRHTHFSRFSWKKKKELKKSGSQGIWSERMRYEREREKKWCGARCQREYCS